MKRLGVVAVDICFLAALGTSFTIIVREFQFVSATGLQIIWLVCALLTAVLEAVYARQPKMKKAQSKAAKALVLLSDTESAVRTWSLTGELSFLIGKNIEDSMAGIDLMDTEFAGMIDEQHAILNYTAAGWVVEDLASRNGVGIRRPGEEKERRLSPGMPYQLSIGDILYIGGDTRLAVW